MPMTILVCACAAAGSASAAASKHRQSVESIHSFAPPWIFIVVGRAAQCSMSRRGFLCAPILPDRLVKTTKLPGLVRRPAAPALTIAPRHRLMAPAGTTAASATMVEFVVDFGKTGTPPPRPTAGWTRPLSTAITRRSGRRLAGFLAAQSGDVLELGSGTGQHAVDIRPPHAAADLVAERYSTTRTLPASPPGARRRGLRTCARRSASILPIRTGRGPAMRSRRAAHRHAVHQRAAHLALDRCRRICSPAPAASCATAAACSSMVRSCATAPIPRRATQRFDADAARGKSRLGRARHATISTRSRETPA